MLFPSFSSSLADLVSSEATTVLRATSWTVCLCLGIVSGPFSGEASPYQLSHTLLQLVPWPAVKTFSILEHHKVGIFFFGSAIDLICISLRCSLFALGTVWHALHCLMVFYQSGEPRVVGGTFVTCGINFGCLQQMFVHMVPACCWPLPQY